MKFNGVVKTDVGTVKLVNQDSLWLGIREGPDNDSLIAILCDGMGGLADGEIASEEVVKIYRRWFENDFPRWLYEGRDKEALFKVWRELAEYMNRWLIGYGDYYRIQVGTTLTVLMIAGGQCYVMNVGDTRAYSIGNDLWQITTDHSLIQREVSLGHLTEAEAAVDSRRNVLLQCIGAAGSVEPDFFSQPTGENEVFLLCTDGFYHNITNEELIHYLTPARLGDKEVMGKRLEYLVSLIKKRKERDNISAILIKTME